MSFRPIQKGATNVSVVIRIIDSTDGTPENGVTSATAGLDLEYRREGAAVVDITESDLSLLTDAHSDGGMLLIGNGYYRLDVPDAAFATGADGVLIQGTATGMVVIGTYVPLVDYNPYDAQRLGLTALPAFDAGAAGGLPDDTDANGRVRVVDGTGAGEIDTASGRVQITEAQIDQIVDETWDEAVSGHVGAGSVGERVERLDIIASGGTGGLTNARAVNLSNLDAAVTTRATPAQVNTEVDTALADVNLDHLVGTATGIPAIVSGTYLDQITRTAAGTFDRATDSLEALRDRGDVAWITATSVGLTAAAVDDIWDEPVAGHVGAGSVGNLVERLDIIATGGAGGLTNARAVNLDNLDAAISSRAIAGDAMALTAAAVDAVWDEAVAGHVGAGSVGNLIERLDLIATGGAGELTGTRAANLDNADATVSSRATPAQVNTEVLDVLNTDTFGESAGVPAATATLVAKISWLATLARNEIRQTATTQTLRNDANSADIATAAVSDAAGTFTRAEWA